MLPALTAEKASYVAFTDAVLLSEGAPCCACLVKCANLSHLCRGKFRCVDTLSAKLSGPGAQYAVQSVIHGGLGNSKLFGDASEQNARLHQSYNFLLLAIR